MKNAVSAARPPKSTPITRNIGTVVFSNKASEHKPNRRPDDVHSLRWSFRSPSAAEPNRSQRYDATVMWHRPDFYAKAPKDIKITRADIVRIGRYLLPEWKSSF